MTHSQEVYHGCWGDDWNCDVDGWQENINQRWDWDKLIIEWKGDKEESVSEMFCWLRKWYFQQLRCKLEREEQVWGVTIWPLLRFTIWQFWGAFWHLEMIAGNTELKIIRDVVLGERCLYWGFRPLLVIEIMEIYEIFWEKMQNE